MSIWEEVKHFVLGVPPKPVWSVAMREYFVDLRRCDYGWRTDGRGVIWAGKANQPSLVAEEWFDGNLTSQEVQAIRDAEDNLPGHNPALRARLLECCGLVEIGK